MDGLFCPVLLCYSRGCPAGCMETLLFQLEGKCMDVLYMRDVLPKTDMPVFIYLPKCVFCPVQEYQLNWCLLFFDKIPNYFYFHKSFFCSLRGKYGSPERQEIIFW